MFEDIHVPTSLRDQLVAALAEPLPDVVDEDSWHKNAIPTLEDQGMLEPKRLIKVGGIILNQLPINQTLNVLGNRPSSEDSISTIKETRKLVMIGRDALVLATNDTTSRAMNTVFESAKALGKVADCAGSRFDRVRKAGDSLAKLRASTLPFLKPVSETETIERCQESLCSEQLLAHDLDSDSRKFHEIRKSFRRIVHLSILSYTLKPNDELGNLMVQGRRLNKNYGDLHDQIKQTPAEAA